MTVNEPRSFTPMLAMGMVGTVVVGAVPTVAVAEEAPEISNENLQCTVESPAVAGPSEEELAQAQQAISDAQQNLNEAIVERVRAKHLEREIENTIPQAEEELRQEESALRDLLDEESQATADFSELVNDVADAEEALENVSTQIDDLTAEETRDQIQLVAADPAPAQNAATAAQDQANSLGQQIADNQNTLSTEEAEKQRLEEELAALEAEHGQPAEPAQPSDPAQPSEPSQPAEPAQPSDPAQPGEPSQPAEPAQPSDPAQPGDPAQPSEKTGFTRDELVPPRAGADAAGQPGEQPSAPGVYTTFTSLIEALRNNTPNVRLGNDVYASELSAGTNDAYVTSEFTGSLDGQNYRVIGLNKPLFSGLNGATVENLSLTSTKVNSTAAQTGALAQTATNGQVSNVHVAGSIRGNGDVGGLVAISDGTTLLNVTVKGDLRNDYTGTTSHVGGLVGRMNGGTLTQGGYQGTISTAHARNNNNRVGGAVGYLNARAKLDRVYAGGSILNANEGGQVGGLVGSTWSRQGHGTADHTLTAVNVQGGQPVHGDAGFGATITNSATWEGESGPGQDRASYGPTLSPAEARAFYTDTVALSRDVRGDNAPAGDGQAASRALAQENYEKLLPFASAEVVKRAADMLAADDPLVTKRLISAVPTVGGRMTADSVRDQNMIDGLILRFSDGTVERRALVIDNRQPIAEQPAHYYMADGLPYTPSQRYEVTPGSVSALANELAAVEWESITPNPGATMSAEEQRGRLFLADTFTAQRGDLERQLNDLIAQESVNTPGFDRAAIEQKIRDHKNAVLLGLAYVNRWYNIDFGPVNLRDVFVFRRDFYGASDSPVDLLIKLGSSYDLLTPQANLTTYAALNMAETGRAELWQALDDLRREFTTYATFDDWFKSTSKAYMVESPSTQVPDRDVTVVRRLTTMKDLKNILLPILTVPEDTVFVTSDMTNISFGSFERYIDPAQPLADEKARIRARVDDYAKRYRDYYDMWYRVGNDTMKQNLLRDIVTWDSLMAQTKPKAQVAPWGDTWRSVNTFFGPIGRWFKDNNSYAYANGSMTWMVDSGILEPGRFGPATFIHEQTHNMDGGVMLGGFGRRQGAMMEVYAKSFLENPFDAAYSVVGFNQVDHLEEKPGAYYLHNRYPSRFQNVTDLNQYFRGWWEAIYLLDNAEAEAMLEQNDADKAKLFMRLGNHEFQGRRHLNSYDALSEADIAGMNLSTIQDLVDNELMLRRSYGPTAVMSQNGYYNVFMLDPLYGTAESNLGITGESAFKRNAFELLGAKGFEEGWVPYVSNKYINDAKAAGLPNMPDTFIMPKIFEGDGFTSLKEYRKEAYRQARERGRTMLKPITIELNGQSMTFTSYEEIAQKFRETVAADLRNNTTGQPHRSQTYALKAALFSQAMRQTDEFKTSIFTDGDAKLQPWVAPAEEPAATPWVAATLAQPEWEIGDPRFDRAALPDAQPADTTPSTPPADGSTGQPADGTGNDGDNNSTPATIDNTEKIQAVQQKIAQQQSIISQLQTKLAQLRNAQQAAQRTADEQNAEAQRLTNQRAVLQQRLDQIAEEKTRLQGQKQAAQDNLAGLRTRQDQAERALAGLNSRIDQQREAVEDAKTALEALRRDLRAAQDALGAATGRYREAKEVYDQAVDELQRLEAAKAAATPARIHCVPQTPPSIDLPVAEFGVSSDNPPVVDLPIGTPIIQIPGLGSVLHGGSTTPSEETQPSGSLDAVVREAPVYEVPGMASAAQGAKRSAGSSLASTGATTGVIGTAALATATAGLLISRRRRDT